MPGGRLELERVELNGIEGLGKVDSREGKEQNCEWIGQERWAVGTVLHAAADAGIDKAEPRGRRTKEGGLGSKPYRRTSSTGTDEERSCRAGKGERKSVLE